MNEEIESSAAFVAKYLDARKVPANQRQLFQSELACIMRREFDGHWDPSRPVKGNGYRAMAFYNGVVPRSVLEAAERARVLEQVSVQQLAAFFPADLCVWTDPYSSSYRSGASGQVVPLFTSPSAPPSLISQITSPTRGRSTPTTVRYDTTFSDQPPDSSPRMFSGNGFDSPSSGSMGPRAFGSPDSFTSSSTGNSYAVQYGQQSSDLRGQSTDFMEGQYSSWS